MTPKHYHPCPASHCQQLIPASAVLCESHLARVPRRLREAIDREAHRPGSSRHIEACRAAVAAVGTRARARVGT